MSSSIIAATTQVKVVTTLQYTFIKYIMYILYMIYILPERRKLVLIENLIRQVSVAGYFLLASVGSVNHVHVTVLGILLTKNILTQ